MRNCLFTITAITALFFISTPTHAQLTVPADGGNKKAVAGERIGITDVTIHYDRPAVKGREGQVWGKLVHEGFADLGFGTSKAAPWRAGSNENTTIEFSTDVKVEGQPLKAGKYGFFIAYNPTSSTLIFSKVHTAWGSYFYNAKDDALRVTVVPKPIETLVERLQYEFNNQTENSATVMLKWEKLSFSFKVEVNLQEIQLASFRSELAGEKSFNPGWQSWNQAALYCLQNNINLTEGLQWAEMAVSGVFIGEANFNTLSTQAGILEKLGRNKEADSAMKTALPMGKMPELHAYGRRLLQQKRPQEAFQVFKMNYDKNPNQFTTCMGLARGYSALGNYKKALDLVKQALPLAPDANNKSSVENMIKLLGEGKDINN
jgi:hypothetical protein